MKEQKKNSPAAKRPRSLKEVPFSKLILVGFAAAFAAVGTYLLFQALAKPPAPTIYLNPAAQTLPANTNFSVQVRVDSGTSGVNAVQANFSYPTSLIDFVSITSAGTAFPIEAQSSGGSGQIGIARGIAGSLTGDQLVATVNFRTKVTTGAAAMAFTAGSALVSSTSNQNILASLSATGGATFTVDATAPSVSITVPAAGSVLTQGNTVNITAAASDNSATVSRVEVFVDGVLKATLTTSPYTYAWNTTALALGNHTIQARAYDPSNNIGTSATITVSLADRTAPTVPGNFQSTSSTLNSVALAWNASTDTVGVSSYRITRNGTVIATTNSTALTYNDTGLAGATTYNYTIVALDAAGNVSGVASLTASTQAFKPGDIDRNGIVDVIDLSLMLGKWGTSDVSADINDDGVVDVIDLSILLTNYG